MKVGEAIQKAKDNGYFWDSECEFVCNESHLMNPDFWEALGKGMKLKNAYDLSKDSPDFKGSYHLEWLKNWHRFIDHLAEGKSIESFFEELPPQN